MISIKELNKKIQGSDELKAEVDAIRSEEALNEFLKKNDCGATSDEFKTYYVNRNVELSDAELDTVSAGSVPDVFHHWGGGNSGRIEYVSCANCGGRMDYSYSRTGFLKSNDHYVCHDCGRDIWHDTIFGKTGVTSKGN